MPNSTPPMITLWKWAIRNRLLCSTKSAGGTASITPVMPPITKVSMKATVHIIGSSNRTRRSEEHTSELQSLMRISYAVFCLKKKKKNNTKHTQTHQHKHNTYK